MNQEKYIGMDVHQATISVAVRQWRSLEPFLKRPAQRRDDIGSSLARRGIPLRFGIYRSRGRVI